MSYDRFRVTSAGNSLNFSPRPSLTDRAWRAAYRLAFTGAKLWWRLRRPRHEGALVAVHVAQNLLLLRTSYRAAWNLPGGGVKSGESPEAAARRELFEETGLLAGPLVPVARLTGVWLCRRETVHIFEWRPAELPPLRLDNREIIAARLVSPSKLRRIKLTEPVATYLQQLNP
jgi:8-oxo-dGTP pyrophosphatase MutT (NUDIX family)